MNQRQQLEEGKVLQALHDVGKKLAFRIKQKGLGTFASSHEILGVIEDELQEYRDAVHLRLEDQEKIEELKDIAVGAIFGIASIQNGGVDW